MELTADSEGYPLRYLLAHPGPSSLIDTHWSTYSSPLSFLQTEPVISVFVVDNKYYLTGAGSH